MVLSDLERVTVVTVAVVTVSVVTVAVVTVHGAVARAYVMTVVTTVVTWW
jgi:hypothetical protein